MRRRSAATALALGALLVSSGAEVEGTGLAARVEPVIHPAGETAKPAIPPEPTTVATVAAPAAPAASAASATKGWSRVVRRRPEAVGGSLLSAYTLAIAAAPARCHLGLPLLEAIGQVESGNAAGHLIDDHHRVVPEIVGPALDGSRYAALPDTDGGTLDHDVVWDHAVGPFQFIPSSWRIVAVDFDGDGRRDPQDIFDAAGGAMVYLCAGNRDLQDPAQRDAAVLAYNHSTAYLRLVLRWQTAFETTGAWATAPAPTLEATGVVGATDAQAPHVHAAASAALDPVALHVEPQLPGAPTRPPAVPTAASPVVPAAPPADAGPEDPPAPTCGSPTDVPSDTPSDTPSGAPSDAPSGGPGDAPTGDPTSSAGSVGCGADEPPVVAGTPTAQPTAGGDPASGG